MDTNPQNGRSLRFTPLLVCLLLAFLLVPFLPSGPLRILMEIVTSGTLLAAILAVSERRAWLYLALALAVPALVLGWVDRAVELSSVLLVALLAFRLLFYAFVGGCLLILIFRSRTVTSDTLVGTIVVYLMLGLVWSVGYELVLLGDPNAFRATEPLDTRALVYFSFVTLSTLGYGDIVPINPAARSLSTLEALTGQIYLAILVARLVGLHLTASVRSGERDEPPTNEDSPA